MKKIIVLLFLVFWQTTQAQNVEVELLKDLNSPSPHRFGDPFFKGISSSTYFISAVAPATVFSVGLLKKDKALRWKSYQMAAGLGISMALSLGLKYSINRTRPGERYSFINEKTKEHSPSFPSGHTTAAFETAMSLSLNFPKWYVIVPAYAWAGAVGYSRMYLGVHYPSDVAAGMLLGTGCAWLTWKVNQKLQKRIKEGKNKKDL